MIYIIQGLDFKKSRERPSLLIKRTEFAQGENIFQTS